MIRSVTIFALAALGSAALAGEGTLGSHFIENWDINEDGQVSLAEATERRSDIFATFDSDDNRVLSAEEYDLFDEARANDQAENEQGMRKAKNNPARGMLREFTDANRDGEVTKAEFMESVPDWFARMDRDGDGVITTADFGPRGS